jgi:hypothetical protein
VDTRRSCGGWEKRRLSNKSAIHKEKDRASIAEDTGECVVLYLVLSVIAILMLIGLFLGLVYVCGAMRTYECGEEREKE